MKPYPAYKDSGVEWLGHVPEGWEVAAPKRYIQSRSGGNQIKGQCADEPGENLFPGFSASGQDVWLDDFQFDSCGLVLSAVGARCGKTFKANGKWGAVANTHCLFPRDGADRDFIWYVTNNEDWWEKGGTAQPFVSVNETLNRAWAFPPLPEQQAIAAFLDRETAKIDGLIEEQRRLIALLAEKRQATISYAVTRGLDPNARLKPSGVDWLGDIPEGWEVVPVKAVATCNDEVLAEGTDPLTALEYVEISGVDANYGIVETTETTFGAAPSRARRIVRNGDVLISTVRTYLRAIAQVVEATPNLVASTGFAVLRPKSVLSSFLGQVCRSEYFIAEVIARSVGVSYPAINASQIMALPVPLPPLSEQQAIAAFLDRETAKLDTLTEAATSAITLLQERRAALISAAVTGKIDVRDLAPAQAV